MMNDVIGKTIGRYQIVEHLGRGGMAEVYKAYQASLDRYVALKLMHTFLAEDPEFYSRFEREAKNIAALHHPNIIQIHDFDREGPNSYMVMEYVDGGTLKDRMQALAAKGESLPLNETIRIIKDIGAALAFAHSAGMIHRDIKPANVLIDRRGRVILTDFGIAKMVSSAKFTASGSLLGTPAYMAPEQGLGQPGDNRADIYSLGVMFYQLVTDRLPYEADTPVAVILKHVNEPMPMPRTIKPDIPVGVERIIAKAMAKDVAQRYQTVDDMLRDLNNLDKAALLDLPEATMIATKLPSGAVAGAGTAGGQASGDKRADSTLVTTTNALAGGVATRAEGAIPMPDLKAKKESSGPNMLLIGGGILLLLLLLLGAVGVFAAPRILAALQPGATATPVVITVVPGQTLPPNLSPELIAALTQQAATSAAINGTNVANQTAIAQLQATDTPVPTANLTATFAACTFTPTITKQTPADGSTLPMGKLSKVTVELQNTGACAWESGTTLAFDSGDDLRPSGQTDPIAVPDAQPNAKVTVDVPVQPAEAKTYVSKWVLKLANGQAAGDPLTLTYKAVAAATTAPTTAAATATPKGPTATAFVSKPLNSVSLRVSRCTYSGANYNCTVAVNIDGGEPVWNVAIDGANGGQFTWDIGDARVWTMIAPRCEAETITVTVIDSNNDQVNNTLNFDPTISAAFPGGGCTQ